MKALLTALLLLAPCAPAWPRAGGGGGGGGGGCFAAGTPVATTAGDVRIEALREGDVVLAYADDRLMQVRVAATYRKRDRLLTLVTPKGKLVTTAEHPLLTRYGFTEAGKLRRGDELGFLEEGRLVWTRVKRIGHGGEADVYNLEVAPPHTFIAAGFVVHNKGGGGYHSRSSRYGRSGGPMDTVQLLGFLLMGAVVMGLRAKERLTGGGSGSAMFPPSAVAPRAAETAGIMKSLGDPSLDPDRLAGEVKSIFLKMQAAWQARNYSPLKDSICPELFASHSAKVESMRARGEINMMDEVTVGGVDFVHIRYTADEESRSFTALITASARDYTLDASGALTGGSRELRSFQEFWTFRLFNGAWAPARIDQTSEDYILGAPNLPAQPYPPGTTAAAAAVAIGAAAAAAAVPERPVPDAGSLPPARAAVRPQEPAIPKEDLWDRQKMEIAATLAFLDVYGAWEKGSADGVDRNSVFPETLHRLKRLIEAREAEGFKFEFKDLYARKAEVVLTEQGKRTRSGLDEFTARISASARRALLHGGKPVHRDAGPEPFTEYWVFARETGGDWKFRDILPRMKQEGGDSCQADVAPTPVQLEWYWRA